jgi:hypothetical protein
MKYAVAVLALLASTAFAQEPTPLRDLQFLLGSWEAVLGPAGSSGSTVFRLDVQGRVIVRSNHAEYPASQGRSASIHDDLMVIYLEGPPPIRAIYFDNESHVIHYTVSVLPSGGVTLLSDPVAGQARYRLSYAPSSGGRIAGEFASAPPEKPAEFAPMFKWELQRRSTVDPTKTPEQGSKSTKNAA